MFFLIISLLALIMAAWFTYLLYKKRGHHHSKNTLSHHQSGLQNEIKHLEQELQHSFKDPITGLPSWNFFEKDFQLAVRNADRMHTTIALFLVDIDNFKMINDAISHRVGDLILEEVAKRLKPCIRQVDAISRFAKDTFAILLTQLVKPETASIVAQRILQSMNDPFSIEGKDFTVTVCIGIAVYPTDGKDQETLLRSADHALHLAKKKGHQLYQFYQIDLHRRSRRELVLNQSLAQEESFKDFILYFSPIKDSSNQIMMMESLLYLRHKEIGLVGPSELFYFAERQRKLNLVSEWLLRHACEHFLFWHQKGYRSNFIIVPISIKQLENVHFIYRISKILNNLKFKNEWLILEINEISTDIPFESLQKAFNMLKYLGIKVMINDFGKSNFPIAYLKNLSIDFLKFDSQLVNDIENNPIAMQLLTSLMALAKNLHVKVICQGIERNAQKEKIIQLGCQYLQGPVVGKIQSAPTIEAEILDSTIS